MSQVYIKGDNPQSCEHRTSTTARSMITLFARATLIVFAVGLPFNLASRYYAISKTEGPVTPASTLCKVVYFREEAPGVLVGINVGVLNLNPDKSWVLS